MAALFTVLILYHLPLWKERPEEILFFILLAAFGMLLDAVSNILRYKKLWCCVSGAVTAAIISVLSPGVPLWGKFVGVAAALILGKYIWGGTGKNWINPAVLGVFFLLLFWKVPYPLFSASYLILPAALLSLPFLKFRPYAGAGFLSGALLSLLINGDFSLSSILSNGVIFYGCIILTDPVTVTRNRFLGLAAGCLAGFISLYFRTNPWIFIACILILNLCSFLAEKQVVPSCRLKIGKSFSFHPDNAMDLTGEDWQAEEAELGIEELSSEEIVRALRQQEVFGMGGAAFPAYKKLQTVIKSNEKKKYLIINAAECDPGLIHDQYVLYHFQEEISKAIKLLENCAEFEAVYLAVRSKEGLKLPEAVKIHKTSGLYPAGAEKLLVKEILHKQLKKGQIPAQLGILVWNVQTVYSIYQAVYLNKKTDTRYLTVASQKNKAAQTVKVKLGMKLVDVMEAVYPGEGNLFVGGGMMQVYHAGEDSVVDKNTNFIAAAAFPEFKESPQCSRCGSCIAHCPAGLRVNKIADFVDRGKLADTVKYHPAECMECGSCSYLCPAGRNLTAKVAAAKQTEHSLYPVQKG
jgi:Predicted NADH:ubiquinone oxidoreductase, subunit RnfC